MYYGDIDDARNSRNARFQHRRTVLYNFNDRFKMATVQNCEQQTCTRVVVM